VRRQATGTTGFSELEWLKKEDMGILNKYKVVIAVVLIILVLVLIRSFGSNHFKSDADKWSEPTVMQSNIINEEQFKALPGEKLMIYLGEKTGGHTDISGKVLKISPDSVLSKIKIIRKHDGPVALFSSDPALEARIWMLLSQMGFRNIYILSNDSGNEALKYKFRSDTLAEPEL
jgi:hypothetical protein